MLFLHVAMSQVNHGIAYVMQDLGLVQQVRAGPLPDRPQERLLPKEEAGKPPWARLLVTAAAD